MTFSIDPAPRNDLVLEQNLTLDGSGNYVGNWLDSAGVLAVRIALDIFNGLQGSTPSAAVEEATYDGSASPRVIRTQTVTWSSNLGYAELNLTTRFYRLRIYGGPANDFCSAAIRRVA